MQLSEQLAVAETHIADYETTIDFEIENIKKSWSVNQQCNVLSERLGTTIIHFASRIQQISDD